MCSFLTSKINYFYNIVVERSRISGVVSKTLSAFKIMTRFIINLSI